MSGGLTRFVVDCPNQGTKVLNVLTRLKAHGCKSLSNIHADFRPFDPDGVGKSNLFEAVRSLSPLAGHTFLVAAFAVRGSEPEMSELRELFWTGGRERFDEPRLAVGLTVQPEATADFGREGRPTSTDLFNTGATPTSLAVLRAMQNWRPFALESSALRLGDRFLSDPRGSHNYHAYESGDQQNE